MATLRRDNRRFQNPTRRISGMELTLVVGVIVGLLFVSLRVKSIDWQHPESKTSAQVLGNETAPAAPAGSGAQSP